MADDLAFPGQAQRVLRGERRHPEVRTQRSRVSLEGRRSRLRITSVAPPIQGPGFSDVARMERSAIRGRLLGAAQSVLRLGALQHVASPVVFGGKRANFRTVRRTNRLMLLD